MMTLLKNDLLQSFGICHLKSFRKKHWTFLLSFVVFFLIILYGLYLFSYKLVEICQNVEMENMVLTIIIITASMFCFITNIYRGADMLFSSSEYNLLLPLPISKEKIIVSKFLSMYLFNLDVTITLLIPTIIAYGQVVNPGLSFYFVMLIASLLIPIIPIALATLIGVGIKAISSRLPFKNVWQIILVVLFLFCLYLLSECVMGASNTQIESMYDNMNTIYPPSYFIIKGVEGSYLYLLGFFAISMVFAIVFVIIMGKNAIRIINLNSKRKCLNGKIEYRNTSVINALYKREAKRYFSLPMYVLNTGILLIILLAFCILSFTNQKEVVEIKNNVGEIFPLIIAICIGLCNTTSCSISLEGKSINQLFALPISSKSIFTSKILFNLSLTIPTVIISATLYGISAKQDVLEFLFLLIIPTIYAIYSSTIGLIINILFPDFEWQNPIKVIKQSLSTLFGMLGGVGLAIIPMVLYFGLSFYNFIFIVCLFSGATIGALWYLYTLGVKRFEKIIS